MIPVISLFINVKNAIEEGIRRTNIRLTGTLQLVMSFVMPLYWQYVYEYSNKHSNSLKKQLSSTVVCNFSLDVRKNHCNFPFKFCLNESQRIFIYNCLKRLWKSTFKSSHFFLQKFGGNHFTVWYYPITCYLPTQMQHIQGLTLI
jgi:hypothetical protein